jgi:hypothetical protein
MCNKDFSKLLMWPESSPHNDYVRGDGRMRPMPSDAVVVGPPADRPHANGVLPIGNQYPEHRLEAVTDVGSPTSTG